MNLSRCNVAVVGASGVVGREMLGILAARGVPPENIVALASSRSAGTRLPYASSSVIVREASPDAFRGFNVALFAASSTVARELAPYAARAGALVIDNSSAFRLAQGVPLIIPEINPDALCVNGARAPIIANPNCSTIIMLTAIEPLRRAFGLRSIHVATYQAVSGAGQAGLDALNDEIEAHQSAGHGTPTQPRAKSPGSPFPEPCFLNVFSHNSAIDPQSGLNGEERKMIDESRKILGLSALPITPTCVRVPVFRAHSQAIVVKLERSVSESQVRDALATGTGVRIIDDRAGNHFPTPLLAADGDDVLVGRIRPDPAFDLVGGRTDSWCIFACGDQLRKGAALNAIQIAELA